MIEDESFFVELVRALAWPTAIAAIAWNFRREIRSLIPRIKRVGSDGVDFEPGQEKAMAQKLDSTQLGSIELQKLPGFDRTELIENVEKNIHSQLALISDEHRLALLERLLAQSRIETAFERIYCDIFGSQITALQTLQSMGGRVDAGEAEEYYDENIKPDHEKLLSEPSFEKWLAYLTNSGLVASDGKELVLTPIGSDFLMYLAAARRPLNRVG